MHVELGPTLWATSELPAELNAAWKEWVGSLRTARLAKHPCFSCARDLAKIGQLMVSGGLWNGQRVAPEGWVAESTKPRLDTGTAVFYGYQWWLGRTLRRGRSVDGITGIGNGGQRLYIMPELDLVIAINASHYGSPLQHTIPNAILNRFVLPAIKD